MFESAELGHKVDKATYETEVPTLRNALLEAQYKVLEQKRFPILILINGVDGAGKGETVNLLNEWMDPRHIETRAFGARTEEERDRPPLWRFWRLLPPKGKIGIFFGSWYTDPIVGRVVGDIKGARFDRSMEEIVRFERMLTNEGALLLKFWFHLGKKVQKKRLETLEGDARTRWRVTEQEWKNFKRYDEFREVSERSLRATSTAEAPWLVVEGLDERYRSLTVGKALLEAMKGRLDDPDKQPPSVEPPPLIPPIDQLHVLKTLDMTQSVSKKRYDKDLEKVQGKLNLLSRSPDFRSLSCLVAFEGVDAAGKGGAIRRIAGALDARHYTIVPVAAPTQEERAQPYLWRFWRHVPRKGHVTVFDRTWYGRVLVERVEGYCSQHDWMRAYGEINDFEEQLVRNGTVLVKFWMQITKEEQLRRFEERQTVDFKKFKIGPDDWRNREKWDAYEHAVVDMVDRTSTELAPWTLVEANDKNFARLKVLSTIAERIAAAL